MAHSETCIICGAEFVKIRNAKTCSTGCSEQNALNKRSNPITLCVICGDEFKTDRNKKTCSLECSDINRDRQYKLQYTNIHKKLRERPCNRCGILTYQYFNCPECWVIIEARVGTTFMEEYRL